MAGKLAVRKANWAHSANPLTFSFACTRSILVQSTHLSHWRVACELAVCIEARYVTHACNLAYLRQILLLVGHLQIAQIPRDPFP